MLRIALKDKADLESQIEDQAHVTGIHFPQNILLRFLKAKIWYFLSHKNRALIDGRYHSRFDPGGVAA